MDKEVERVVRVAVGERLRDVLRHLKTTATALASRVGVDVRQVYAVMQGRQRPTMALILGLQREYGIMPTWLLIGEGAMEQSLEDLLAAGPAGTLRRPPAALAPVSPPARMLIMIEEIYRLAAEGRAALERLRDVVEGALRSGATPPGRRRRARTPTAPAAAPSSGAE